MAKTTVITRKVHRDGNLYPEAHNLLKIIPEGFLYHISHGDRHPFSRYSNSLQKILGNYSLVLNEVNAINVAILDSNESIIYDFNKLSKAQEGLLFALLSHFDDCYAVLKSICPPDSSNTEVFVDRRLKIANHPTFPSFKTDISVYRDSFDGIVNNIKHEGGKLCSLVKISRHKGIVQQPRKSRIAYLHANARLAGYYLEGMQPDGTIGPHPEIHPGNVAISLNYDLRYHFANIYRISKRLSEAVRRGVKLIHGEDLPYTPKLEKAPRQEEWAQIAEQISKIPKLFYRNEFNKNAPDISVEGKPESAMLIIAMPGSKGIPWQGEILIQSMFQIDSSSLSYRPPYGI